MSSARRRYKFATANAAVAPVHTLEDIAINEISLLRSLTETSLESFSSLGVDGQLARGDLACGRLSGVGWFSCSHSGSYRSPSLLVEYSLETDICKPTYTLRGSLKVVVKRRGGALTTRPRGSQDGSYHIYTAAAVIRARGPACKPTISNISPCIWPQDPSTLYPECLMLALQSRQPNWTDYLTFTHRQKHMQHAGRAFQEYCRSRDTDIEWEGNRCCTHNRTHWPA